MTSVQHDNSIPLSVIIVTYNSADEIGECLHSLLPQVTFLGGEIIIVDNASRDDTLAIVEDETTDFEAIQVIKNQRNYNFSVANNQGLEAARGEHLLILNPDTQVQVGSVEILLNAIQGDNHLGAVAPQLLWPDGHIQRSCRRFPTHWDVVVHSLGLNLLWPESRFFNGWKMGDFNHAYPREVDQPAAAALMVRGSLLRELKGFDRQFPMFFNDVDLCRRIHAAGYKILFQPEAQVVHLGGSSVLKNRTTMIISSHISFFRYLEKYYDRFHHQLFNLLAGLLLYLGLIPRLVWHWLGLAIRFRRRDAL
ncbi:MAG: glycosyltransferase family 2 protein [Lentisphaeria bacterium]|nr:glycosyltransferase family 2 protein [Candidatus Neomarinimicrobiota bacterium]MCF7842418.1 glycosyltransferase family 2 protein [Lentisphaeria bacterium]